MAKILGEDGRCDPSKKTIPKRVGCSVSAVNENLNKLRDLGRITWERRLRRDSETGWRCEQTSNAYVLLVPSCESPPASPVRLIESKKEARQPSKRVDPDFQHAARQLEALGYPVPEHWPV